jgi:three-Cys-motif partner protein
MSDAVPPSKQQFLFDASEFPPLDDVPAEPSLKQIERPVCTANKAQLIMRYLRYFVFITKHGTYIDGFAGPQEERPCDTWSAKLVIESEPKWMRHFHLCDVKRSQVKLLRQMKASQAPCQYARNIQIYEGNFNEKVEKILRSGDITEKEATFCLLDQRTFECEWATVEQVARCKNSGTTSELFYFLANSWQERAFAAQKKTHVPAAWWGRSDWKDVRDMTRDERRDAFVERFRRDLGYRSAKPWPIFAAPSGGALMYYMIHATDHLEAPKLMSRAYHATVSPSGPFVQETLFPHPKSASSTTPDKASRLPTQQSG